MATTTTNPTTIIRSARPDMTYMTSDLSRSSSQTPDERLVVAEALPKRVRSKKYCIYTCSNKEKWDLVCFVDASYNQNTWCEV